jgi:hypothetical protein
MAFKIEQDVPLPQKKMDGLAKELSETLSLMKIGDSFVVPYNLNGIMTKEAQETYKNNRLTTIRQLIKTIKLDTEEFKSAKMDNGTRIWKVEFKTKQ